MDGKSSDDVGVFTKKLFSDSWNYYKDNFIPTVVASLIPVLITFIAFGIVILSARGSNLIEALENENFNNLEFDIGVVVAAVVVAIGGMVSSLVVSAGIVKSFLTKKSASVKSIWAEGKPYIGRLLSVYLQIVLLIVVIAMGMLYLTVAVPFLIFPFFALLFVGIFVLSFSLAVLTPVVVMEELRAMESVKRSIELSRKYILHILVYFFVTLVISLPTALPIVGVVFSVLISPFSIISIASLYRRLTVKNPSAIALSSPDLL